MDLIGSLRTAVFPNPIGVDVRRLPTRYLLVTSATEPRIQRVARRGSSILQPILRYHRASREEDKAGIKNKVLWFFSSDLAEIGVLGI